MLRTLPLAALAVLLFLASSVPVGAQPSDGPTYLVEAGVGRSWFLDSPPIPHVVVGAGARRYLTRRLALGPEVTWMGGEGAHRDVFVTGNVVLDLADAGASGARTTVVPYLVGGAGLMTSTALVGTGLFTSHEPAFTGGGGVRFTTREGWFVAPEARLGWETHWRMGVSAGLTR